MTPQLQQMITAVRMLPPRDKLVLLEIISHDLQQSYAFAEESAAFWSPRSLEELVQTQAAPIVTDIHTLAVDFWPEEESADDFNQFIAGRRAVDRMGKA